MLTNIYRTDRRRGDHGLYPMDLAARDLHECRPTEPQPPRASQRTALPIYRYPGGPIGVLAQPGGREMRLSGGSFAREMRLSGGLT